MVESSRKKSKDTEIVKIEQWADTADAFVNLIYKKLRNKNKKLEKIQQTVEKIKKAELKPNQEQLEMINSKEGLVTEMKDLQGILKMYEKAFPDNPVWSKKKGKKAQKEEQPKAEAEPEKEIQPEKTLDVSQIVSETLSLASDTLALVLLQRFDE